MSRQSGYSTHDIVLATEKVLMKIAGQEPAQTLEHPSCLNLRQFIEHLLCRSQTSWNGLLLSLIYVLRFRRNMVTDAPTCGAPSLRVMCLRRCFFSAVLVARKFHSEVTATNRAWAGITELSVHEVGQLEAEFLNVLDFDLYVSHEEFQTFKNRFVSFFSPGQVPQDRNKTDAQRLMDIYT